MLHVSTHLFPRTSFYFMKVASTHSGRLQIRQLEVERKFCATPAAISYLRSKGEGLRFKKHVSLGKQTTHDTYYDRDGLLFSKGVYIRRRNEQWEAKIRTGGDYVNSAFTEIEGNNAVKEVIERNLAFSADGISIEKMLEPCAEFVTNRESWMIDDGFKVDVDSTDFGHTVGEVELTRTLQYAGRGYGKDEEEEEKRLQTKMDQEIMAFMQSYPQAFPAGRPLGKLSAYIHMLNHEA